jgi:hypothetical protein
MDDINEAPTGEAAPAADPMADFPRDAKPWLDLIKDGTQCFQAYQDKCDNIDKLYANLEKLAAVRADREFQIFWANLEVLKPSIYARPPVPVVVPRFKDTAELPRQASEVLERTLCTSFDLEDIDSTMRAIRDDMAINARGVVWLRYEAEQIAEGQLKEKACYDHIDRKDFLHEPARKWKEVGWVAKRDWLNREDGVKRFGDEFLKCSFEKHKKDDGQDYEGELKAQVWEIWSKRKKAVVWVSPGMADVLDVQAPWLDLENFFPCPRPAYGTLQRGSLIPVPDFVYYRDQIEEINELTARIAALCESLRMKGFYAAGSEDISAAIESAIKQQDNAAILIPVPTFALAAGNQTIKDAIAWLPVVEIATVIKELIANRKQLIDDVYQITGLSDIMRGETVASETLGAQKLKSQYGSIRIRDRQAEIVRIARDITRMGGEIISENFQPETLRAMSQVKLPSREMIQQQIAAMATQAQAQGQPAPPPGKLPVTFEDVTELLQANRIRPFVLDIETDSTIQPDEDADKQRRTEFLSAVGGFFEQAIPLVQQVPEAAPLATEMLKFAAAGFRAGRPLEGAIEELAEKIKQKASQPPPPNPEQQKMQQEMQIEQGRAQADMAMKQLEGQIKQIDLQIKQIEAQGKLAEAQAAANQPAEAQTPFEAEQNAAAVQKTMAEIEKIRAEIDKIRAETPTLKPIQDAQAIDHAERQMELAEKPEPKESE